MVLMAVCGSLVLSILAPAVLLAERWVDDESQRVVDRIVCHEPVESWDW
jgi:hypothetical protein